MIRLVIWDLGDTINTRPPGGQDLKPLDEYPEIELRPGVISVLQQVQQLGCVQAVLSNTSVSDSVVAQRMLSRLGIKHFFSQVYATASELDTSKPGKPDAIVFKRVLDAVGVVASEAVMVGNTWESDILGANRCGIHALFLQNPDVMMRTDFTTPVQMPPWIVPVWDVVDIPQALHILNFSRASTER
ncbi:HAD family hydrolase [Alicyclobacillaceae bacterium I2511]|nr:HAD family hydrolase [Alicyclobacillaceae bacterium I2511]